MQLTLTAIETTDCISDGIDEVLDNSSIIISTANNDVILDKKLKTAVTNVKIE